MAVQSYLLNTATRKSKDKLELSDQNKDTMYRSGQEGSSTCWIGWPLTFILAASTEKICSPTAAAILTVRIMSSANGHLHDLDVMTVHVHCCCQRLYSLQACMMHHGLMVYA